MIKILKKRILSNKGFSYVILSVLMIVILLMGVAIFEIIRINIQAAAVRDKFEDAIISMCVENYSEMYQPIRESHASSYAFNGTRWEERHKANEQYIRTYLNKAMSAGEIMQCEIVSISFDVDSPSVAPPTRIPQRNMRYLVALQSRFRIVLPGRSLPQYPLSWT